MKWHHPCRRWSIDGSVPPQGTLLYSHNQGEASGQGASRRAALKTGLQQSILLGAILGGGAGAARADGIDLTELKDTAAKESAIEGIAQQLQQAQQGELQPQFYLDQIEQGASFAFNKMFLYYSKI
jgi:hypothetical protein